MRIGELLEKYKLSEEAEIARNVCDRGNGYPYWKRVVDKKVPSVKGSMLKADRKVLGNNYFREIAYAMEAFPMIIFAFKGRGGEWYCFMYLESHYYNTPKSCVRIGYHQMNKVIQQNRQAFKDSGVEMKETISEEFQQQLFIWGLSGGN